MIAFFIIAFVILTASVGYVVFKSSEAQERQAQNLQMVHEDQVDAANELVVVTNNLSQRVHSEPGTFEKAAAEAFGAGYLHPFSYNLRTPDAFSIRHFVQILSMPTNGFKILRVFRNLIEYPHCAFIIMESPSEDGNSGARIMIKLSDTFTHGDRIKDQKYFESWKEEEGSPEEGKIWINEYETPKVYVDPDCGEQCSFEDLRKIREAAASAKVEIAPLKHSSNVLYIHNLKHEFGRDSLTRGVMRPSDVPWSVFTASYPGNITIAGVKKIDVGNAVDQVIKHGPEISFNLAVEGETGTGKSTLFKFMASKLAYAYQAAGKNLMIAEWRPSSTATDPAELVRYHCGEEKPMLLIIEDIHLFSEQRFADVLNLMDGINTPEGLSVMFGFNRKEVHSDRLTQIEALIRPGRTSMHITLQHFDKDTANKLIEQIRKTELIEIEGAVDALPERASLAQIWACFRNKTMSDIL